MVVGLFLTRLLRQLVMLVIIAGVIATYGTLIGRDAGVALLILLAAMKLLEMGNNRDFYVVCLISLFLILTGFFYSQTILSALHMLLSVLIIISAMTVLNDPKSFVTSRKRIEIAASLLIQSVPILFILFILFPRIDGPLWGLPKDARSGQSGLDDEMSPGQISQLSLSDAVAFRVEFDGEIPDNSSLYWRGPVLWYSDGVKWVMDKSKSAPPLVEVKGKAFNYTVTMEANNKPWLFGLEIPSKPPAQSFFSHDFQIITKTPVYSRRRYEMSSHTDFRLATSGSNELSKALQLPRGYHPRARAMGEKLRADNPEDPGEIITQALRMFNSEDFYYTLSPPLLLNDSVDEFLFETRQGFCEHYASAFVILMRAAGVPARVVTGYQGGSLNPVGNYLVVRQRDAHAWAEVWMDESGWTRIDPTAAVSPSRINDGIETALPATIVDVPLVLQNSEFARDTWRRLRNSIDAVNNRWNQWVLGYNNKRQNSFLNWLGFGNIDWRSMTLGLIGLTFLSVLTLTFVLFRHAAKTDDAARQIYLRFCQKLERAGLKLISTEGPVDLAKRAGQVKPEFATDVNHITQLYIQCRYNNKKALLTSLKEAVGNFP